MQAPTTCCTDGCQLCHKEREIQQMQQRHRRDLSLQSIYRKDYHNNTIDPEIPSLPHRTKNESSNIQGQPKAYFVLNSTYGLNFQPKNPQRPVMHHSKDILSTSRRQSLQNYKSTYQSNYHQHPTSAVEENYKIADPQFYNLKTPFPQVTEYKKNFKLNPKTKFKNALKSGKISFFETTQRHSYIASRQLDPTLPVIPHNNMTTLPTTAHLFSTTYRNEFIHRSKHKKEESSQDTPHLSHFYNF